MVSEKSRREEIELEIQIKKTLSNISCGYANGFKDGAMWVFKDLDRYQEALFIAITALEVIGEKEVVQILKNKILNNKET